MKVRVNEHDYNSGIVIEVWFYDYWAVPAWEEWSLPDLAGPFETIAEAQRVLDEHRRDGQI